MSLSKGLTRMLKDMASAYVLKEIGVSKHEIHFVTPPKWTPISQSPIDLLDDFHASKLVNASFSLRDVGIICSSGTAPALRAVFVYVHFTPTSPHGFRIAPDRPIRYVVHNEETVYRRRDGDERAFDYEGMHDFTPRPDDAGVVKLPILDAGEVHYLLKPFDTGLHHQGVYFSHEALWKTRPQPLDSLSPVERQSIDDDLRHIRRRFSLEIVLLLDNEDTLAFHWSHQQERFIPDVYNVGFKRQD